MSNRRQTAFDSIGREIAYDITPLDTNGNIDPSNGKIGFISIGMSNTSQEFSVFKFRADADARKNSKVTIVNCAQGGQTAEKIIDTTNNNFWDVARQQIRNARITDNQVQVAWLKEANINPKGAFPIHAEALKDQLKQIVAIAKGYFPNLKLVYVSSRIYAGYGPNGINPEPFAYESGFSVKWLVEDLMDEGSDPWVAWGPYLWANGTKPRIDGLTYSRSDLSSDGIHPSDAGRAKVATQLMDFFLYDVTTKPWFRAQQFQEGKFCDSAYITSAVISDTGVFPGELMLQFQNESPTWWAYPILHCTLEPNPYFTSDTNMNVVSIFQGDNEFSDGTTDYPVQLSQSADLDEVPDTFQLRGVATIQFHDEQNSRFDTCTFRFSLAPGHLATSLSEQGNKCAGRRSNGETGRRGLSISPNPVSAILSIDRNENVVEAGDLISIEVVSAEGVVAFAKHVESNSLSSPITHIDVSAIPIGTYSVRATFINGVSISRVTVLR